MALEDYAVPAENDLHHEGGVAPIRQAAKSSQIDRTVIRRAVGVMERRYPDRVFQRTAATRGHTALAPIQAPAITASSTPTGGLIHTRQGSTPASGSSLRWGTTGMRPRI